jgi:tetratricopeptide (TPR) repeat protein
VATTGRAAIRLAAVLAVSLAGWGLGLAAIAPAPLSAQAGRAQVREGNRLYEEGRFEEAHEKYLEGLAEAPESPVILFNDGNALYRSEDYRRALEAYQQAIDSGDAELASAAWYNLGNALYRQRDLQPSLEAYKQALRLSPGDVDAKHNLERVLQELQQEQQDQSQDQQGGQDQQDPRQGESQPEDQSPQGQGQDRSDRQQGDDPEDRQDPQAPGQDRPQEQDGEPQDGQGQPERRPGQMTPEEAERLLDAIDEDPDDVERRRAPVPGPRPRRPW